MRAMRTSTLSPNRELPRTPLSSPLFVPLPKEGQLKTRHGPRVNPWHLCISLALLSLLVPCCSFPWNPLPRSRL